MGKHWGRAGDVAPAAAIQVALASLATASMLSGIGSMVAHQSSADLSAHIKRGKARQRRQRVSLGGPTPDGYQVVREHNESSKLTKRTYRLDGRSQIYDLMFQLAGQGLSDLTIVRRLAAANLRKKSGKPFNRRAVRDALTNPWYCGRIAYFRRTRGGDRRARHVARRVRRLAAADHGRPSR